MPKTGLDYNEFQRQIILSAEKKIREIGFNHFTLADLARDLHVSHAALYRYVPNKEALLDAISEKWLARIDSELEQVIQPSEQALPQIVAWFCRYYKLKREKVLNDPEIYKSFNMAVEAKKPFVKVHLDELHRQLTVLVRLAIDQGMRTELSEEQIVTVLMSCTMEFHHPRLVAEHGSIDKTDNLKTLLQTIIQGISAQQNTNT